ncbi:MAG TPA: hypothetical protein VGM64_13220 [Lacunisphaera sp.]|jgi:hypothetical protein
MIPAIGRPPLLAAAVQTFLDGQQRWAYEETFSSMKSDGSVAEETVVRIDPSQPYPQQRVPVKIRGQPPTEKQLRDWAKASEAIAQRRLKLRETQAVAGRDQNYRLQLTNRAVNALFDEARVIAEDGSTVTYEIPLRELGVPDAALVDDHQLIVRVNRERRVFEHATIRQTKMVRIAAGKYSDGLVEAEFAKTDAPYPAVPVQLTLTKTNKPLFGPSHTTTDRIERRDFNRVTPYDERLNVKLGPLQLLDF